MRDRRVFADLSRPRAQRRYRWQSGLPVRGRCRGVSDRELGTPGRHRAPGRHGPLHQRRVDVPDPRVFLPGAVRQDGSGQADDRREANPQPSLSSLRRPDSCLHRRHRHRQAGAAGDVRRPVRPGVLAGIDGGGGLRIVLAGEGRGHSQGRLIMRVGAGRKDVRNALNG